MGIWMNLFVKNRINMNKRCMFFNGLFDDIRDKTCFNDFNALDLADFFLD